MKQEAAFTGQTMVGNDEVACSKCGGLVGLHNTGWFDQYNDPFKKGGSYVHYDCLSAERMAEIKRKRNDK